MEATHNVVIGNVLLDFSSRSVENIVVRLGKVAANVSAYVET